MKYRPKHVVFGVVAAVAGLSGGAWGQWPANPAVNLAIGDRTGEQVQPKVRPTSDGGCYVSWFDNSGGGYDVYLQKLNSKGQEQWAHNGVLVADLGLSSTNDYGLAVDAADNAVLAFQDDRTGGTKITVSKVSPAGTLVWGSLGVQVTQNSAFSPRVAATSDGFYVAAWTEGTGVRMQKLDANGVPQWAAGGINSQPATGSYSLSDLKASDNGSVIVLWVRPLGNPVLTNKHLYTQKFDGSGAAMWNSGNPVIVYDGGSVQNGYFPAFVTDGSGGAVYGWYENSGTRNGYVQRVNAAGAEVFPHNGVACSTVTGSQARISSSVGYDAATNSIYFYWTDTSLPTQNAWGVFGQKFDGTTGARLWTDSAKTLVPMSANQTSFVNTVVDPSGNSMVFWFDQPGSGAHVMGARLDGAGNLLWTGSPVQVCAVASGKARLEAAIACGGNAIAVWTDSRTDSGDVYSQNIRSNGAFGTRRDGDVDNNGVVNVADLLGVINGWGSCSNCAADVAPATGCPDGLINVADLLVVINNWG